MIKPNRRAENARAHKSSAPLILREGMTMHQDEFHRAYDAMPEYYRAELIAGVVREPSPLSYEHSVSHPQLAYLICHYAYSTRGLQICDNPTVILSDEDEVQPDVVLRIDPELGGQSGYVKLASQKSKSGCRYIKGAPELVAEVANTSRDIDLRVKKEQYAINGVSEYIVACLRPKRFYWFNLKENRELEPDSKGVFRSEIFPGLRIHGDALLKPDTDLAMHILKNGMRSKKYKQFASGFSGD